MESKRIAAMDISLRRIGIAFSDINGIFIHKTFLITSKMNIKYRIKELYAKYQPILTYIGLPTSLNTPSKQTAFVKTFTHSIRNIIGKFEYEDEYATTKIANEFFNTQKTSSDECAAEIILARKLNNITEQLLSEKNIKNNYLLLI